MRVFLLLSTLFVLSLAADLHRGYTTRATTTCSTTTKKTTTTTRPGYVTTTTTKKTTTTRPAYVTTTTSKTTTRPATTTYGTSCAYTKCIKPTDVPAEAKPVVSKFCQFILHTKPGTSTVISTQSSTTTITPSPVTEVSTVTVTPTPVTQTVTTFTSTTETSTTTSTTTTTIDAGTTTVAAQTFVEYQSRPAAPTRRVRARENEERDIVKQIEARDYIVPPEMIKGCSNKWPSLDNLRTLCSCFLTSATVTSTTTVVGTATASGSTITSTTTTTLTGATTTVTSTETSTSVTTITTETTISATGPPATVTAAGGCGNTLAAVPQASTSGTLTCSSVPAPSLNARHRIEGNDSEGTIFEDCIVAAPGSITTPSGGTHKCDGTNGGANPNPGVTISLQLSSAAQRNGFPFDGSWSSSFEDYFITSIGASTQNSNQFWGVLRNGQFTPNGGCQAQVQSGDRSLWAFDAFSKTGFLNVSPDFAVAQAGQGTVSVTITESQSGNAVSGASFAGASSDGSGAVTFAVPTVPGCYQYKATRSNYIRSNAFYLNVVSSF